MSTLVTFSDSTTTKEINIAGKIKVKITTKKIINKNNNTIIAIVLE